MNLNQIPQYLHQLQQFISSYYQNFSSKELLCWAAIIIGLVLIIVGLLLM